jgi:hypothetical protein
VENADTYVEINRLLDKRVMNQHRQASPWKGLLKTTSPIEQSRIVVQIRDQFLKMLQPWPGPKTDLDPASELWFAQSGIDISLVRLRTHPGVSLLCALLIPQKITTPGPALLVLHGMYGNLQSIVADIDYHHGFGMKLAKKGFVVLAPQRVASTIETRNTLYAKSIASGWTLESIDMWQLTRALDYLASLKQVNPKRIGVYGISLGGQHALWLSALDPRISLTVCSAYFSDRFAWLFKRVSPSPSSPPGNAMMETILLIDTVEYMPNMAVVLDDLNLVALIQPRFFGVVTGMRDPRHDAAEGEFKKVSQLYKHVGHPQRATFTSFDGGHETNVESVLPFLKRWVEAESWQ